MLSEAMQAFLGLESCGRHQVVKAIWVYIKEHNLQVNWCLTESVAQKGSYAVE